MDRESLVVVGKCTEDLRAFLEAEKRRTYLAISQYEITVVKEPT